MFGRSIRRNRDVTRQLCLFPDPEPGETPTYYADPDDVRGTLMEWLGDLQSAEAMPWDKDKFLMRKCVFPQMTNWLPADEAADLNLRFAAEVDRLSPK
jgi:hypothetical protein